MLFAAERMGEMSNCTALKMTSGSIQCTIVKVGISRHCKRGTNPKLRSAKWTIAESLHYSILLGEKKRNAAQGK